MRINTQRRPGMVHSQKAIRALSLLNKPVTSLHMKLSLGELLTNTSSKVWHALHLTPPPVNVSIPPNQDNSPESPHALWWHLILKSLWEKPALSLCEERKNSTFHSSPGSPLNHIPNCPTTDKSTGTLEKDYQIVAFYYRKQIQFKDN